MRKNKISSLQLELPLTLSVFAPKDNGKAMLMRKVLAIVPRRSLLHRIAVNALKLGCSVYNISGQYHILRHGTNKVYYVPTQKRLASFLSMMLRSDWATQ